MHEPIYTRSKVCQQFAHYLPVDIDTLKSMQTNCALFANSNSHAPEVQYLNVTATHAARQYCVYNFTQTKIAQN